MPPDKVCERIAALGPAQLGPVSVSESVTPR
jgi:hypothetical protein